MLVTFTDLPKDVVCNVGSNLNDRETVSLSNTCKIMQEHLNEQKNIILNQIHSPFFQEKNGRVFLRAHKTNENENEKLTFTMNNVNELPGYVSQFLSYILLNMKPEERVKATFEVEGPTKPTYLKWFSSDLSQGWKIKMEIMTNPHWRKKPTKIIDITGKCLNPLVVDKLFKLDQTEADHNIKVEISGQVDESIKNTILMLNQVFSNLPTAMKKKSADNNTE